MLPCWVQKRFSILSAVEMVVLAEKQIARTSLRAMQLWRRVRRLLEEVQLLRAWASLLYAVAASTLVVDHVARACRASGEEVESGLEYEVPVHEADAARAVEVGGEGITGDEDERVVLL